MKKLISTLVLLMMFSCVGNSQNSSKEKKTYKVEKTDIECRAFSDTTNVEVGASFQGVLIAN